MRRGLRTPPVARRVRAATIGAQRSSKHCGAVGGGALGRSVLVPITLLTVTQCQHCCRSARSPCVAALSRAIRYPHSVAQVCLRLIGRGCGRACSIITSNTSNTLTVATITLPVAGVTQYAILEGNIKGTGCSATWAFGTTDPALRGRYMFIVRGGAQYGFERVDLTTDRITNVNTSPLDSRFASSRTRRRR